MSHATDPTTTSKQPFTVPLDGEPFRIGSGFSARSFRARDIGAAMDPLVLVDHYVMTESTFGTHPHAGMSAVSLLFEDSDGRFHNRDSLGNDFDLMPGDLYWLRAGRGALHNESPRDHSRTHGLQVFVNVPQASRHDQPSSLLVRRQDMPVISSGEHSVRVAVGESNGVVGARSPGLPMTILDGSLDHNGRFKHALCGGRNAWVQAIDGPIEVIVSTNHVELQSGQAIAIDNAEGSHPITVRIAAGDRPKTHFALLDGQALKEPYIQQGPFVMGSAAEIESTIRAYDDGRFGSID